MQFLQSALALATQQRNQPRQELDTMYARSRQAGQDVMQNAQIFSSMADRAAARQEQRRQFDIVQAMREEEFDLNKKQAMASLTERNTAMKLRELELTQKTKALDELPGQQAAQMAIGRLLGDLYKEGISDPATINKRFGDFFVNNPEVTRYIPQPELQKIILDTQKAMLGKERSLLAEAQEVAFSKDLLEFDSLAPTYDYPLSKDYMDQNGRMDERRFRKDLADLRKRRAEEERMADTSKFRERAQIQAEADVVARADQQKRDEILSLERRRNTIQRGLSAPFIPPTESKRMQDEIAQIDQELAVLRGKEPRQPTVAPSVTPSSWVRDSGLMGK